MTGVSVYIFAPFGRDMEPMRPVKIGIAGDVEKRIAAVQTGSPKRLKIIGLFDTPNREIARKFELAFHKYYADKRLSGEWFDVDPIDALALACNSFRVHLTNMAPQFEDPLERHLEHAGVLYNEHQVKVFRSWREYYAENSNVQAIA